MPQQSGLRLPQTAVEVVYVPVGPSLLGIPVKRSLPWQVWVRGQIASFHQYELEARREAEAWRRLLAGGNRWDTPDHSALPASCCLGHSQRR